MTRGRRGERTLESETAVQVMAHRRDNQKQQKGDQGPVHEEGEERQLEHIETDCLVELRVAHSERLAAPEHQPVLPLAIGRYTEDQGEDDGDDSTQREGVPADDLLIAPDDLKLGETSSARGAMRSTTHKLTQQATKNSATNIAASSELRLDHQTPHGGEMDRAIPEVIRLKFASPCTTMTARMRNTTAPSTHS